MTIPHPEQHRTPSSGIAASATVPDCVSGMSRETVACAVCGAQAAAPLCTGRDHLTGEEFSVVRCMRCALAYVNPRPTSDNIGRFYPTDYYGNRHPLLSGLVMGLRMRKLPAGERPGRLLDIGAGNGAFILHCRQRGWRVAGVEHRGAPVMAAKDKLGIEVYESEQIGALPAESFDVVTIWHVLEHLPDPAHSIREVRRVLRPGGTVLIEVPNFGGWQGRFGGADWFHLDVPRHLFHFNKASLTALLERNGLQPLRWETFSLEYDAFGLAQTVLNRLGLRRNHLFQLLIRRADGAARGARDTLMSVMLFPFLLAVALPASAIAAGAGQGGVLRVWARRA